MADYDIAEAFQLIEEEMIASMSRNLSRHLEKELGEGINYSMWQAEQLAALNNFRKNNEKAFKGYFSTINKQIETILRMAHQSGAMDQEARIFEAIKKGWKVRDLPTTDALQGSFFRINERKLNALIEATTKDMERAETAMLRMADDEYRKAIFNAEVYYNTGAGTLSQCVDMATKDFLSRGISCIEYANGARVGIDAYAQMALRTTQTRAYLSGEASKRDEWGVNTVIVNRRGVACPRCLRYVGRIFYDDVWGNTPIPEEPKYPLLSDAIDGGLYHPNCKDIHTTYFEGVNTPPKPMTAAEKKEAARVYDLEQKQRYNERMIRKYKRLEAGSVDPENKKKYAGKRKAWQAKQRDFIAANGDVLKRRYENEKLRVPSVPAPPPMLGNGKNAKSNAILNTPGKIGEKAVPYSQRDIEIEDRLKGYSRRLASAGDYISDVAGTFKYRDLAILTTETGVEYTSITMNGMSYLIRGEEKSTTIPQQLLDALIQHKGMLDCHSHPFIGDLIPSESDKIFLELLTWQKESVIIDPKQSAVKYTKDGITDRFDVGNTHDESYLESLFGGGDEDA